MRMPASVEAYSERGLAVIVSRLAWRAAGMPKRPCPIRLAGADLTLTWAENAGPSGWPVDEFTPVRLYLDGPPVHVIQVDGVECTLRSSPPWVSASTEQSALLAEGRPATYLGHSFPLAFAVGAGHHVGSLRVYYLRGDPARAALGPTVEVEIGVSA